MSHFAELDWETREDEQKEMENDPALYQLVK